MMSIVTALAILPGETLAARQLGGDAQADSEEHFAGASGHLPSLWLWLSPWPRRDGSRTAWCTDQTGKNRKIACAGLGIGIKSQTQACRGPPAVGGGSLCTCRAT